MGLEPSQLFNFVLHRRTSLRDKDCLTPCAAPVVDVMSPKTTDDAEERDKHVAKAAMLTTQLAHRHLQVQLS
jgi:hypothetical protein